VLASCLPPLVLASFRSLIDRHDADGYPGFWPHALAPFGIVALLFLAPELIDGALIVLFIGYALALLRLGRAGPDALDEARFEGAVAAHRALIVAAGALCLSAVFDIAVYLDFEWSKGANAAWMVGNANLLGLLLIGLMATVAAGAQALPEVAADAGQSSLTAAQDRDILERVERLLAEQKLFLDENLTLSRLARRAGLPARQISGAVNRIARRNVSQFINDYRIAEACRLLQRPDISITAAMLECGFQTKSNFNREFRRVTSLSPAAWREKNRAA
jgi:AraC-like DNA-binding protein